MTTVLDISPPKAKTICSSPFFFAQKKSYPRKGGTDTSVKKENEKIV